MLEIIQSFIDENIDKRPQILDLFYNLSFSLLHFSRIRFHNPNKQNLLKILRITSTRLLDLKYPNLIGRKEREIISNFINLCKTLFNSHFIGDNFYRYDDILREYLFESVFEEYFEKISEGLDLMSEEGKNVLKWILRVISERCESRIDPKRTYNLEYFQISNNNVGILNHNSNQQLNTSFNTDIIYKTIWELGNFWTPIERKQDKHRREQKFIFWGLGDFIVKYGIGFWSPYFTQKNNYRDREDINVDLIIPNIFIEQVQDIIGVYDGRISELESLPNDLNLFGEPTHDWIKDYLCDNVYLFEEIIDCDIINIQKEYKTNEIGDIDILLEEVNGIYWIVEIKPGEPNYRPIGQILNYMNWVREKRRGQVRGILIVRNISPQLRTSSRELNRTDIEIWTYEVSENQEITLNRK